MIQVIDITYLQDKLLIDEFLGKVRLKVLRLQYSEEELVAEL